MKLTIGSPIYSHETNIIMRSTPMWSTVIRSTFFIKSTAMRWTSINQLLLCTILIALHLSTYDSSFVSENKWKSKIGEAWTQGYVWYSNNYGNITTTQGNPTTTQAVTICSQLNFTVCLVLLWSFGLLIMQLVVVKLQKRSHPILYEIVRHHLYINCYFVRGPFEIQCWEVVINLRYQDIHTAREVKGT